MHRSGALGRPGVTGRLPALIRSCDLVLAVPWYEPFGIVPLEAMACGVPVVGTAVGGLLDTIVHGVTGLLIPPRSPVALADAVLGLLRDEPLRRAMGVAGRRRVVARYTWESVIDRVVSSYRRAIDGRAATMMPADIVAAGKSR